MSACVQKGSFMAETFRHWNFRPNVGLETLENYIYCSPRRQQQAPGDHGRPREATEASSRAQILARFPNLGLPPGDLKLRLFGQQKQNLSYALLKIGIVPERCTRLLEHN